MASAVQVGDYESLRDRIVAVLKAGKVRAQQAVEKETLRTYHEIGRLLNDYILDYKGRGDYGANTVKLLAQEVGIGQTLLYQALISTDQNLKYQQNLSGRQLAIIVLLSTSWPRIQLRIDEI